MSYLGPWSSDTSNDTSSGDFPHFDFASLYGNVTWGGRGGFKVPFYYYIVFVLWVLLFLLGISGNGFVIYLFYKKRSLRVTRNCFILHFCIINLLVFVLGVAVNFSIQFYPGDDRAVKQQLCNFSTAVNYTLMFSSLMLLVCSSVDRYISIHYPFKNVITSNGAKLLILFSWLYGVATAAPPVYYFGGYYEFVLYNTSITVCGMKISSVTTAEVVFCGGIGLYGVLLPVGIVCFCYARILKTAWAHARSWRMTQYTDTASASSAREWTIAISNSALTNQIMDDERTECELSSPPRGRHRSSAATLHTTRNNVQGQMSAEDRRRKLKGAITVLLIVGVMLLSWIPYVTIQGLYLAALSSGNTPSKALSYTASLSISYPCISAAISPFVFGFRTVGLKEEFVKALRFVFRRRLQSVNIRPSV